MNVNTYKFLPEKEVIDAGSFVEELQWLCNNYKVVLVADREQNISIRNLPEGTSVSIEQKQYYYGEHCTDLEQTIYES